jgi:hypothetical protein
MYCVSTKNYSTVFSFQFLAAQGERDREFTAF